MSLVLLHCFIEQIISFFVFDLCVVRTCGGISNQLGALALFH